jgi:hypothetical protein
MRAVTDDNFIRAVLSQLNGNVTHYVRKKFDDIIKDLDVSYYISNVGGKCLLWIIREDYFHLSGEIEMEIFLVKESSASSCEVYRERVRVKGRKVELV